MGLSWSKTSNPALPVDGPKAGIRERASHHRRTGGRSESSSGYHSRGERSPSASGADAAAIADSDAGQFLPPAGKRVSARLEGDGPERSGASPSWLSLARH